MTRSEYTANLDLQRFSPSQAWQVPSRRVYRKETWFKRVLRVLGFA